LLKILSKSIYEFVQASRQWWKKQMELLTGEVGFTCSKVDSCLLNRENEKGIIYMCLYVDDVLCTGSTEAIDTAVGKIKNTYSIKEMGKMYEYVGCTIIPDKENLYLIQPDLIEKLMVTFGEEVKNLHKYTTPAAPGEPVVRPTKEQAKLLKKNRSTTVEASASYFI
jgi:Reverse transcriptase (RNA-dependent DNA polymerase)